MTIGPRRLVIFVSNHLLYLSDAVVIFVTQLHSFHHLLKEAAATQNHVCSSKKIFQPNLRVGIFSSVTVDIRSPRPIQAIEQILGEFRNQEMRRPTQSSEHSDHLLIAIPPGKIPALVF